MLRGQACRLARALAEPAPGTRLAGTESSNALDHLGARLHSDTDLADDWESALFEVGRKVREALRASRALVALL